MKQLFCGFKIIFFIILLFISVSSTLGITFYYQLYFTKNFHLKPSNINVVKNISVIFYISPSANIRNGYEVGTFDPAVTLYRDGVEIWNGSTCKSFGKYLEEVKQPFAIVLDDHQLIKYMIVQNDESELIKNMKLLLTTAMQVNIAKLNQELDSSLGEEITFFGKCNVNYTTKLEQDIIVQKIFSVKKNYDTKTCTRHLIDQSVEDSSYLKDICKSEKENNLQWAMNAELTASKLAMLGAFINNTNFNLTFQMNPLRNSDSELSGDLTITYERINESDLPSNFATRKFNGSDVVQLSEMVYKPVNKTILSKTDPKVTPSGLQEMYRSLVCESSLLNLEYDLFERAITCLSNPE